MKIQGQYYNTQIPDLGPLNDNKGVGHLWNISSAVAHAKEHLQIPSNCRRLGLFIRFLASAGDWQFFRSGERRVWYAQEGFGGANAIQSPTLAGWDLTKDSRHSSSCQMTHVLNNIANP